MEKTDVKRKTPTPRGSKKPLMPCRQFFSTSQTQRRRGHRVPFPLTLLHLSTGKPTAGLFREVSGCSRCLVSPQTSTDSHRALFTLLRCGLVSLCLKTVSEFTTYAANVVWIFCVQVRFVTSTFSVMSKLQVCHFGESGSGSLELAFPNSRLINLR